MLRLKLISFLCCVLSALWFATGEAAAQSSPAAADEQAPIVLAQSSGGGLFRALFGKRRNVKRGGDIGRGEPENKRARKKKRWENKSTATGVATPSKPPAVVEKKADAKVALVVGDFMGNALAKGLIDALSSNPNIQVINASNGSSGLVRSDFYNWNTSTPQLVAKHNASLILVMVGANDRQAIRTGGKPIEVGDEAWKTAYDAKVTELAEVLSSQAIPVFWVGLAPVAKTSLSRDYSVFNSLYRQKAELKGFKFVDIWNGFADDKGKYVARGPDINGQTRTLRGSSGLSFTSAGRRKLAFFVERDVVKFLSDDQAAIFAALQGAGEGAAGAGPVPIVPAVSAMLPIESINIKPGSELSVAPEPAENPEQDAMVERPGESEKQGEPEKDEDTALASNSGTGNVIPIRPLSSPSGRADNFSWPAPQ